jgi:hypothetical protein
MKAKLFLYLIHTTLCRRMEEWRYTPTILNIGTIAGVEWLAARPFRLTPEETAQGTHCMGGWVGPTADLDVMEKKTILPPTGNRTPIARSSSS